MSDLPSGWEQQGDCVVCDCGFRFGQEHPKHDDTYECPCCKELELATALEEAQAEIAQLATHYQDYNTKFDEYATRAEKAEAEIVLLKLDLETAEGHVEEYREKNFKIGPALKKAEAENRALREALEKAEKFMDVISSLDLNLPPTMTGKIQKRYANFCSAMNELKARAALQENTDE